MSDLVKDAGMSVAWTIMCPRCGTRRRRVFDPRTEKKPSGKAFGKCLDCDVPMVEVTES